ncbi:carboxymuconolactone decarboxylase family protein [Microlunatus speluncae]|uniref:carboxymuconolactone decarboxylase family protein n=1 Tax=Microlunatus speluncae TaxID=2594267 RepID=UPI0012666CE4|nr:carboxymuconolactone decarboxylase family protein [Microlunatus speluncae]
MTNSHRIQLSDALPEARKHLVRVTEAASKAASDAGLSRAVTDLVRIRVSQVNGCAYCTDTHSAEAIEAGEQPRRIFVLPVWRETELFTEQERAALELAEAMTELPEHREVSDEVYLRATKVLGEDAYVAVAWVATAMNALNRLGVTSRKPLPA